MGWGGVVYNKNVCCPPRSDEPCSNTALTDPVIGWVREMNQGNNSIHMTGPQRHTRSASQKVLDYALSLAREGKSKRGIVKELVGVGVEKRQAKQAAAKAMGSKRRLTQRRGSRRDGLLVGGVGLAAITVFAAMFMLAETQEATIVAVVLFAGIGVKLIYSGVGLLNSRQDG